MNKDAVFLFINDRCNLRCEHCYVSAERGIGSEMSFQTFVDSVEFFGELGITDFRFTGGEPTIHKHFVKMTKYLLEKGHTARLVSNGLSLMRDKRQRLALDHYSKTWISVYGLSRDVHRQVSGNEKEDLEETLRFVGDKTADGHWIGISAMLLYTKKSEIPEFLNLCVGYGVRRVRLIFCEPTGRASTKSSRLLKVLPSYQNGPNILSFVRSFSHDLQLDYLSLNDPFDLTDDLMERFCSCILRNVKMWAIGTDGRIFSCCYNIGRQDHQVSEEEVLKHYNENSPQMDWLSHARNCGAMSQEFWPGISKPTCPISSIRVI